MRAENQTKTRVWEDLVYAQKPWLKMPFKNSISWSSLNLKIKDYPSPRSYTSNYYLPQSGPPTLSQVSFRIWKKNSGTSFESVLQSRRFMYKLYRHKLYRHNLYRHKLYRHKLYREQIVSGTNCIGNILYRAQIVSCNKLYRGTNCIL